MCNTPFDHLYLFGHPIDMPLVEPKCCCHGRIKGITQEYQLLPGKSIMDLGDALHVEDWNSMDPSVLASEYMLTTDERKKIRKSIHCLQEEYRDRLVILSDV